MCGRYTLTADLKTVVDRFGVPVLPASATYNPRFNIAPTQAVIVVGDDGKRYMKQMLWGLIPSWAKDPGIGNRMINARARDIGGEACLPRRVEETPLHHPGGRVLRVAKTRQGEAAGANRVEVTRAVRVCGPVGALAAARG